MHMRQSYQENLVPHFQAFSAKREGLGTRPSAAGTLIYLLGSQRSHFLNNKRGPLEEIIKPIYDHVNVQNFITELAIEAL